MGEFKLELQFGSIRVEIGDFLSRVNLKFDRWPWKIVGHLFYIMSSCVHPSRPSVNSNLSYSLKTLNSGQNRRFCVPSDLEIRRTTLYVTSCKLFQALCIMVAAKRRMIHIWSHAICIEISCTLLGPQILSYWSMWIIWQFEAGTKWSPFCRRLLWMAILY